MAHDDQQLFERFRRHGDVGALGDLFDRVAPALLRLALHLSRDPAAAEDLLQSAFLRAIEVREEWDGRRPLLPWLCGILQNRAHHQRWQSGRAPDPARLAAPPPIDPAKAAERSEFDAAVDAAIAELPEPLRPVLRLHLAYGHGPAEIAHALERPPGTVRSQLARGLSVLRRVLPAGFAGVAALTFATGRGLAAVKQVVLGNAVVAVPAVVAGAMLGGVAVMKKVAMVVVVTAFAAGAWFALPKPEAALPPAAVKLVLSPISEPVPMHEWFVWTRDGEPFQRYENWWEANGERTWSQRMLPGVHEVMITSETGRQETTRFVVDANDRPDRQIAIKLP